MSKGKRAAAHLKRQQRQSRYLERKRLEDSGFGYMNRRFLMFRNRPSDFTADWLYGWKVASSIRIELGELRFSPNVYPNSYGLDSYAVCGNDRTHDRLPADGCGCGFYSVKHQGKLPMVGLEAVVLRVALSGLILAYEHGYRAEHQIVTDIFFRTRCYYCAGEGAETNGSQAEMIACWGTRDDMRLVAVCRRHAYERDEGEVLTPEALSARFGVSVQFR